MLIPSGPKAVDDLVKPISSFVLAGKNNGVPVNGI